MKPFYIKAHEVRSGDTIVWTTSVATAKGKTEEYDYRGALFLMEVKEEIEEREDEFGTALVVLRGVGARDPLYPQQPRDIEYKPQDGSAFPRDWRVLLIDRKDV